MAADFVISLKRPSYRAIDTISILLIFLFISAFFYFVGQVGLNRQTGLLIAIPVMIMILMIYGFSQRKRKDFLMYFRTELFIAAIGWFMLPLHANARYLGWAYAIMGIIERYVKAPDEWSFSKEGVTGPGIFKKNFEWVEIDNVIIRDNIFTLDFTNNRVIQKALDQDVDKATEEEFNNWCKQQLHFNSINNKPLE